MVVAMCFIRRLVIQKQVSDAPVSTGCRHTETSCSVENSVHLHACCCFILLWFLSPWFATVCFTYLFSIIQMMCYAY